MAVKETSKNGIGSGKAGPGRPKGSANKVTADLRTMVLNALTAVGGQEYLQRQAEDNATAFLTLVGKCLPKEITGKDGQPLIPSPPTINLTVTRPDG